MKLYTAAALLACAAALPARRGGAQTVVRRVPSPPAPIGDAAEARARVAQLRARGDTLDGWLLRSPSSRAARVGGPADDARGDTLYWAPWVPEVTAVNNSALPFSLNDGAMWAGRGLNVSVTGGARARYRFVHLVVAPTFFSAQNQSFVLPSEARTASPIPPARSPYSYPWRVYGPSIDLPIRFGPTAYRRLELGQSALYASLGAVEAGFSNESEWWGPGVRNALVLSNNAGGVPKLFVRTARPLATRVGAVEARYLLGALATSPYFEAEQTRGRGRSLNAAAVTLRPAFAPTLTVGAARAVFAQTGGVANLFEHSIDVLTSTGRPNALPLRDYSQTPGKDQIYSLFARWVLPDDGFESYAEWGRTEMPKNLRDLLVSPNHSQGYTLGLQYAWPATTGALTGRVQAEVTNVAQSSTFLQRPMGSWYTSRAAVQGYTQRGQVLGAAIGPGSHSQWLAGDVFGRDWEAGLFAGRIRWDDDAYYNEPNRGFCYHDVSLFGGARGGRRVPRVGTFTGSVTITNRLNAFFQNDGTCFQDRAERVDVLNTTLALVFTPRAAW